MATSASNLLERVRKKSPRRAKNLPSKKQEQAVLVLLDRTGAPENVHQQSELAEFAEELKVVIARNNLGQYGGNEFGPNETTLFMFGPDAEKLFAGVEPTLRACSQCRGARVLIRRGGPGAEQREVKL